MKDNKETKITIRVHAEDKQKLKSIATNYDKNISQILRELIEEYIAKECKQ
jgi:predicted DNA-binding protein